MSQKDVFVEISVQVGWVAIGSVGTNEETSGGESSHSVWAEASAQNTFLDHVASKACEDSAVIGSVLLHSEFASENAELTIREGLRSVEQSL